MGIYWVLAILAAFLQGASDLVFWPLVPVLGAASRVEEARKVYFLAFVTGMVTDLLVSRTLGLSAVFLLLSCGLIYLYHLRGQMRLVFLLAGMVILNFVEKLLWG